MNIQTVATNLRNTIAGKKMLLAKWQESEWTDPTTKKMMQSMINMLELNIDDLVKILADVEQCCEQATLDSWTRNPDRSGGQFTEEEINRGNEWR
jgi:hypothetical protein